MNKMKWVVIYGGTMIFSLILSINSAPLWAAISLTMIFHLQWSEIISKEMGK